MNLDTLAENASRLGARIQETISERTRDLAARSGSSLFLDGDDRQRDIRKQLDTGSDREKLDAMKRLIGVCLLLLLFLTTGSA
jgi:AP-3 complex subunit beta